MSPTITAPVAQDLLAEVHRLQARLEQARAAIEEALAALDEGNEVGTQPRRTWADVHGRGNARAEDFRTHPDTPDAEPA